MINVSLTLSLYSFTLLFIECINSSDSYLTHKYLYLVYKSTEMRRIATTQSHASSQTENPNRERLINRACNLSNELLRSRAESPLCSDTTLDSIIPYRDEFPPLAFLRRKPPLPLSLLFEVKSCIDVAPNTFHGGTINNRYRPVSSAPASVLSTHRGRGLNAKQTIVLFSV